MHFSEKAIRHDLVQMWIKDISSILDLAKCEVGKVGSANEAISFSKDKAGVYLFYGDEKNLVHIGQSTRNVAGRLRSHTSARVQESEFWKANKYRYVQAVCFDEYEKAPEFEAQLIERAKEYSSA